MNNRPNILYIMTDQQSATMMSCAGNADLKTPAMDHIASVGCRFDRAYCSNPVCMPSRTSLFSCQYPSYLGIIRNDDAVSSFPPGYFDNALGNVLRGAGYKTLYGGKQHFNSHRAEDLGFDVYSYDEREELAVTAADMLREYDDDKPFFMVVSLINPHDICYAAIDDCPHNSLQEERILANSPVELKTYREIIKGIETLPDDALPELPANFEPQKDEPDAITELIQQRVFKQYARAKWSERKWREHRYAYCRLSELVDRQVQKVLDAPDLLLYSYYCGEYRRTKWQLRN